MFSEFRRDVEKTLAKHKLPVERLKIGSVGDLSFPAFGLDVPELKPSGLVGKIARDGDYVNFYIDWEKFGRKTVRSIGLRKKKYGGHFQKGSCLIEHTSINPNASPHIGRSRNAIIGDTFTRMLRHSGLDVEAHYFVNDIGRQIAVLVAASPKNPTFSDTLKIYIDANQRMETDEDFEKQVNELIAKVDSGDRRTQKKFDTIVGVCMRGILSILSRVSIEFDKLDYESDYLRQTEKVLNSLKKMHKLKQDEQGVGVEFDGLPFALLKRSDGTSLYMLRDLPYQIEKSGKAKLNYIVLGEDQKLYFRQVAEIMKLLSHKPPEVIHYSFVSLADGKMSTRKGNVVLLEDLVSDVRNEAFYEVQNRHQVSKDEAEKRALPIAVAAIRYGMIKISPEKDITFDPKSAVNFEGDTGPYLQYSYARMSSILKKAKGISKLSKELNDEERDLLKGMSMLEEILKKSIREKKPNHLATYARDLCMSFNRFYEKCPVLQEKGKVKHSRIAIMKACRQVLANTLNVLGIEPIEEM